MQLLCVFLDCLCGDVLASHLVHNVFERQVTLEKAHELCMEVAFEQGRQGLHIRTVGPFVAAAVREKFGQEGLEHADWESGIAATAAGLMHLFVVDANYLVCVYRENDGRKITGLCFRDLIYFGFYRIVVRRGLCKSRKISLRQPFVEGDVASLHWVNSLNVGI